MKSCRRGQNNYEKQISWIITAEQLVACRTDIKTQNVTPVWQAKLSESHSPSILLAMSQKNSDMSRPTVEKYLC